MSNEELYQAVERCRRKLLSYSWQSKEAREECWAAESELYALEEDLLRTSGEPVADVP